MSTRSYSISVQNQWLKRNGNLCAAKELRRNPGSHFHRVNRKVLRRKIAKTSIGAAEKYKFINRRGGGSGIK